MRDGCAVRGLAARAVAVPVRVAALVARAGVVADGVGVGVAAVVVVVATAYLIRPKQDR